MLAGDGHNHPVVAVRATDTTEAPVQIATLEEGRHGALDNRTTETVPDRKPLVVNSLEGVEVPVQQPQVGQCESQFPITDR